MAFRLAHRLSVQNRNTVRNAQKRTYATVYSPKAEVSSTSQGIRVASQESNGPVACLSLNVRAGCTTERSGQNGAANLLGRLAAKSIKLGTPVQAITTRERTQFHVQCLKGEAPAALQALGDMAKKVEFTDAEFEAEKEKVVAEQKALVDVFSEQTMMDYYHSAAFQSTPLGFTAAGDVKSLKSLKADDLREFHASAYNGNTTVVSGFGTGSEFSSQVESAFSDYPSGYQPRETGRIPFTGSNMAIRDDTVNDAKVVIGYETFGKDYEHVITAHILKAMIGHWQAGSVQGENASSRLAEKFALTGFSSSFKTFVETYENAGTFGFYLETDKPGTLDDMVYEAMNEIQKIYAFVAPQDLQRAKNQVKADFATVLDNPQATSAFMARHLGLFARLPTTSEVFHRIDLVSEKDVEKFIEVCLYDVDPAVVSFGKIEEMPDYAVLRGWTYWNRW